MERQQRWTSHMSIPCVRMVQVTWEQMVMAVRSGHGEMLPIIKTLIYSWKSDLLKIRKSIWCICINVTIRCYSKDMEECLIRISLWQMSNRSLRLTQHCVWKGSILHRKMVIKIGCLDWVNCRLHRIGCSHWVTFIMLVILGCITTKVM